MSQANQNQILLDRRYKKNKGRYQIDLFIDKSKYLFDRKDPSPLKNRDLHPDVTNFICGSLEEIPQKYELTLNLLLSESYDSDQCEKIRESIRNYFFFEVSSLSFQLKKVFLKGMKALLIGSLILLFSIYMTYQIETFSNGPIRIFIKEGLTIFSWVSMWFPFHVFLYEWWPISEKKTIMGRGITMEIVFSLLQGPEVTSE